MKKYQKGGIPQSSPIYKKYSEQTEEERKARLRKRRENSLQERKKKLVKERQERVISDYKKFKSGGVIRGKKLRRSRKH